MILQKFIRANKFIFHIIILQTLINAMSFHLLKNIL